MKEQIGEKIHRLRKETGKKQSAIHDNQSQISLIESGKITNPDESTLLIIAENMKITLDELIEDTDWVKPKTVKHSKEIAVSPKAWDFKIDDTGDIKWSCKIYERYNENGEENKFCPDTGAKLIVACSNCGRNIESGTQLACMSCGGSLIRPYIIDLTISEILNPVALGSIEGILDLIVFMTDKEIEFTKKAFDPDWIEPIIQKMFGENYKDKKDKEMEDNVKMVIATLIEETNFNLALLHAVMPKLKRMADKLSQSQGGFLPVPSIKQKTENVIYVILKEKLKNAYNNDDEKTVNEVKDELLELLEFTKSSKLPEVLLSKLQSKKISEDGNSESTENNDSSSKVEEKSNKRNEKGA